MSVRVCVCAEKCALFFAIARKHTHIAHIIPCQYIIYHFIHNRSAQTHTLFLSAAPHSVPICLCHTHSIHIESLCLVYTFNLRNYKYTLIVLGSMRCCHILPRCHTIPIYCCRRHRHHHLRRRLRSSYLLLLLLLVDLTHHIFEFALFFIVFFRSFFLSLVCVSHFIFMQKSHFIVTKMNIPYAFEIPKKKSESYGNYHEGTTKKLHRQKSRLKW